MSATEDELVVGSSKVTSIPETAVPPPRSEVLPPPEKPSKPASAAASLAQVSPLSLSIPDWKPDESFVALEGPLLPGRSTSTRISSQVQSFIRYAEQRVGEPCMPLDGKLPEKISTRQMPFRPAAAMTGPMLTNYYYEGFFWVARTIGRLDGKEPRCFVLDRQNHASDLVAYRSHINKTILLQNTFRVTIPSLVYPKDLPEGVIILPNGWAPNERDCFKRKSPISELKLMQMSKEFAVKEGLTNCFSFYHVPLSFRECAELKGLFTFTPRPLTLRDSVLENLRAINAVTNEWDDVDALFGKISDSEAEQLHGQLQYAQIRDHVHIVKRPEIDLVRTLEISHQGETYQIEASISEAIPITSPFELGFDGQTPGLEAAISGSILPLLERKVTLHSARFEIPEVRTSVRSLMTNSEYLSKGYQNQGLYWQEKLHISNFLFDGVILIGDHPCVAKFNNHVFADTIHGRIDPSHLLRRPRIASRFIKVRPGHYIDSHTYMKDGKRLEPDIDNLLSIAGPDCILPEFRDGVLQAERVKFNIREYLAGEEDLRITIDKKLSEVCGRKIFWKPEWDNDTMAPGDLLLSVFTGGAQLKSAKPMPAQAPEEVLEVTTQKVLPSKAELLSWRKLDEPLDSASNSSPIPFLNKLGRGRGRGGGRGFAGGAGIVSREPKREFSAESVFGGEVVNDAVEAVSSASASASPPNLFISQEQLQRFRSHPPGCRKGSDNSGQLRKVESHFGVSHLVARELLTAGVIMKTLGVRFRFPVEVFRDCCLFKKPWHVQIFSDECVSILRSLQ